MPIVFAAVLGLICCNGIPSIKRLGARVTGLRGIIRLMASVVAMVLLVSGCGAPDPSFAGLSDDQMKGLFPTEAEVKSVLGSEAELREPQIMETSVPSPSSSVASPSTPRTMDPGMPEGCREFYFGSEEAQSIQVTRGFDLRGTLESDSIYGPSWRLRQHPSALEARRSIEIYDKIARKCEWYQMFPVAGDHSTGESLDLRNVVKEDVGDVPYTAQFTIAVGDVSMAFGLSCRSREEGIEIAKKMAIVVERRLQAAAPK